MGSCSKFFVFSIFLFLLLSVSIKWVGAVDENVVALDIAEAEEILGSAYGAVLEAEEAGANVSGLLVRLNLGGEYLAEAYVCYRLGDSENASRFVGLCYEVVEDLGREAVGLRNEAERVRDADFVIMTSGAVVGVVVVLILGLVIWRVFKQGYRKRLLELRPEVVSGES